MAIDQDERPGDILIFLTSQEECETAARMINDAMRTLRSTRRYQLEAMPLYAGDLPSGQVRSASNQIGLPYGEQLRALGPAPRGYRKAICSTNVAETSVTAEGVVYVIDCCFFKSKIYDPRTGLSSLITAPISKACPGTVSLLYSYLFVGIGHSKNWPCRTNMPRSCIPPVYRRRL